MLPAITVVARACAAARGNGNVRRSLWAGTPILNMAVNAKAERLLGVRADTLVYETYFITRAFTYNLSRPMRIWGLRAILPYFVLLWASIKYQRFHFYCDCDLLGQVGRPCGRGIAGRDAGRVRTDALQALHFLRRLGKQVFFWTYGADVRTAGATKALGEPNCCTQCPAPGQACICDDKLGLANIAAIRAGATALFSMGDMQEYTPGSRNDLFFWPVDLDADDGVKYAPHYPPQRAASASREIRMDDGANQHARLSGASLSCTAADIAPAPKDGGPPLRIVHAPNHRHFKGTQFLIDAVEQLRREGLAIELRLVERLPNDEALAIYRTADLVFDQCLIGFHGYFAIEAMALGKPAMCFIRRPAEYLIDHEHCPIVNVRPEGIADAIRQLAADRGRLRELGLSGRRYVEKYFSLQAFADRLRVAYADLATGAEKC